MDQFHMKQAYSFTSKALLILALLALALLPVLSAIHLAGVQTPSAYVAPVQYLATTRGVDIAANLLETQICLPGMLCTTGYAWNG